MKQQTTLKVFKHSLALVLVFTVSMAVIVGLKSQRLMNDFNSAWLEHILETEEKQVVLNTIRIKLGFGGFIHHYKNYVLRQDDAYLRSLYQSQDELAQVVEQYSMLPLTALEKKSLEDLQSVIDGYVGKIPLAINAQNEGWSQSKTDFLVLISDEPAFEALNNMESVWQAQYKQDLERFEDHFNSGVSLAYYGSISVILLVLTLCLNIWFIYRLSAEIHKRHDSECQLYLSDAAIVASSNGVSIADDDGNFIFVNPAFEKITGYSADEVIGKNPRLLSSGRHDLDFFQAMWREIESNKIWEGEIWNRNKNGELYLEWITIKKFPNRLINTGRYLAIFSDITLRKKRDSETAFQATHDMLTDLPNRALLYDRVSTALVSNKRNNSKLALLFLDLDKFKTANDLMGHLAGDQILVSVSHRIRKVLRESDSVFRYGGDEFIVLIPDLKGDEDWKGVTEHLLESIKAPYIIDEQVINVSASIGVAMHSAKSADVTVDDLISTADKAMYQAKKKGGGKYCLS